MSVHVSKSGSHLIRLSTPGVRVRRATVAGGGGGFTPASLPGLDAWFKADAGTSTTTDGAAISQWSDQSGNARHLTQATGANQPIYKAAIQNGKPIVRFNGSTNFLSTSAWTPGAAVTAFVVVRPAINTGQQHILVHAGGATWASPFAQYVIRTNTTTWQIWRDSAAGSTSNAGTVSTTNFKDVAIVAGSTASSESLFEDGTAAVTAVGGTPFAPTSQALFVGAHQGTNAAGDFLNGDIGEIVIYNTALSTTDRQSVESYLRTRWGTA